MKRFFYIGTFLIAFVALSSCGSKDNGIYPFKEEAKYLTVRLQGSDKWSIINIENGDIVAKNAISGMPSAVHEDMFYVYDNETARINYYNVNDLQILTWQAGYGTSAVETRCRAVRLAVHWL